MQKSIPKRRKTLWTYFGRDKKNSVSFFLTLVLTNLKRHKKNPIKDIYVAAKLIIWKVGKFRCSTVWGFCFWGAFQRLLDPWSVKASHHFWVSLCQLSRRVLKPVCHKWVAQTCDMLSRIVYMVDLYWYLPFILLTSCGIGSVL